MANNEHIIFTLYAYPTLSTWQNVESAAPTVSHAIVDICAPDGSGSGCNGQPADAKNPDWAGTITTVQNGKVTKTTINVHNKLSPFDVLRNTFFLAFVGHPLTMNLATFVLILAPFVGLGFFLRGHIELIIAERLTGRL